ncbi:MAG: hypothetical protein IJQ97_07690, partial [Paludibacteraceae bacterium]|nr:hypothetical protein [Paludibacteraceae bacterium]
MKKFLSLVSALALVLPLLAGTVTFKPGDFAGQGTSGTGSAVSVTKGGVTLSCDKGFGSTSALRCYKNGVVTITSETKISTIDFSFETASGQTYNGGLDAQVTVNDMSWTNTLASQARFTEVVVTIEGEGVALEKVDTISVTQALARIEGGVLGECYVKGKVLSIITNNVEQYGNISYWMADIDNPNDSLQAYRMKGAENKNYASAADIEFVEGDEILVYAAGLAMYHNNNTNVDIPELNTGYYVRTLKGKEIVTLDWAFGSAYRGANQWTLEILKANNDDKNALNLVFQSSKTDAIAGYHTLAEGSEIVLNGAKSAIASGSVKLTFKKIGDNSLNIYDVQATLNTADKAYRLNQEVEFYASDEESGDEIVLKGDRPFTPTEGQEITCAQAREYALSLPQGSTGEITVTVHGYITDLFSNGITFWMADQKGEEKVFQSYLTVVPTGKALENGLEVKVTGKVTNYNGTPEISKGQLEFVGDAPDVQT